MSSIPTPPRATRSEKADAVTVLLYGAAVVVIIGILTASRILRTFRDGSIAWTIPIDEQPVDAALGLEAPGIEGIATEALVLAPDVNAVSVAAIIASIALWTAAALLIVGSVMYVAWSFLRGRFFLRGTARAFDIIGWTLIAAPIVIIMLDTMGRNGVLAALGIADAEPVHPIAFWTLAPLFAIGVASGLIGVAFRRGTALQRDTEGLV